MLPLIIGRIVMYDEPAIDSCRLFPGNCLEPASAPPPPKDARASEALCGAKLGGIGTGRRQTTATTICRNVPLQKQ